MQGGIPMSFIENRNAEDRGKVFYEQLDRFNQAKQDIGNLEGDERKNLEGFLLMTTANMAVLLAEMMQENLSRKPQERAHAIMIAREYAKDHPGIDLKIWRDFWQIRMTFAHTKWTEIPVDTLTETVVPEFVKEYEILCGKSS